MLRVRRENTFRWECIWGQAKTWRPRFPFRNCSTVPHPRWFNRHALQKLNSVNSLETLFYQHNKNEICDYITYLVVCIIIFFLLVAFRSGRKDAHLLLPRSLGPFHERPCRNYPVTKPPNQLTDRFILSFLKLLKLSLFQGSPCRLSWIRTEVTDRLVCRGT